MSGGVNDDAWLEAEREHERAMAGIKQSAVEAERKHVRLLAEQRTERIGYVVVGTVIAAVILGIAWFIWNATNSGRESAERVQVACVESGGTWTDLGLSDGAACYHIDIERPAQ